MTATAARATCASFSHCVRAAESRKSPQNSDFYGHRTTYSEKAHCIKDSVLLDPACGSGNFLITAYKELCHLDMEAIRLLDELPFVGIHLDNFYGIEIDDFPCEIARLSLWLAQHQINMECLEIYGNANPTLPLTETGHIVCGNALRLDWNEVCPADSTVIIASNPPYSGRNLLDDMQVAELTEIMKDATNVGYLDYVWCWIKLSAQYINSNRSTHCLAGMVATNSIGQGIQAPAWLAVSHRNCDIFFAYESFKWANNAKDKAGVTVTIVGIKAKEDDRPKHIYGEDNVRLVSNINPYLIDASDAIVTVKEDNTTGYRMNFGTMYRDGGNLIMSTAEKKELLKSYPAAEPYIHRFIGSEEFINGKERWCLWITDDDYPEADRIPPIHERIEAVRAFRLASKASSTRKFGETPWKAAQIAYVSDVPMITIPRVSSERREYIPIGYLAENTVVSDLAYVIYNGPYWLFSVLTSRMHMAWVRTVAGRLKTDYRYSNTLCYNTFPFPTLSDGQKKALEESAMRILEARENHYENTMAQLYDPGKMPDDLRAAHESNDLLVDSLYRKSGFDNDSERLQELFRRYKEATGGK